MTRFFSALIFAVGLGSCFSIGQSPATSQPEVKSPLAAYIENLRDRKSNTAAAEFTKICGVKMDESWHRFGFSNDVDGNWEIVASLPKEYYNLGTDQVGTAELWKNSGGIVIEEWKASLDTGNFERTFYCFDGKNRLKALDSSDYQVPNEGTPWGMHERWILQSNGSYRQTIPLEFIGPDDNVIPKPRLDDDGQKLAAGWGNKPPSSITIQDLKLPINLSQ